MNVVNATLEVDFLGQCASESLGSTYWSSSGGSPTSPWCTLSREGQASSCSLVQSRRVDLTDRLPLQLAAAGDDVQERVDKVVTSTESPSSRSAHP